MEWVLMRLTPIRLEIYFEEGFPTTAPGTASIKISDAGQLITLIKSHRDNRPCILISRSEIRQNRTIRSSALPKSRSSPCDTSFTQRHPPSTLCHRPHYEGTYHHVLARHLSRCQVLRIVLGSTSSRLHQARSSYRARIETHSVLSAGHKKTVKRYYGERVGQFQQMRLPIYILYKLGTAQRFMSSACGDVCFVPARSGTAWKSHVGSLRSANSTRPFLLLWTCDLGTTTWLIPVNLECPRQCTTALMEFHLSPVCPELVIGLVGSGHSFVDKHRLSIC